MDRIPPFALLALAAVFAALGVWAITDENWAGVIASVVLVVLLVAFVRRGRR